jgi:hypothetical protein
MKTLASMDFPHMNPGGGAGVPPIGNRRGGRAAARTAGAGNEVPSEDWGSLEVTGSLVLAAVLLLGLGLRGRPTA